MVQNLKIHRHTDLEVSQKVHEVTIATETKEVVVIGGTKFKKGICPFLIYR